MLRPLADGQFLWGTLQDAAGAVGTQLRAFGRSPGDGERPQVIEGDPSALLPLPGLRAEPRRGNDHEGAVRDGGRPNGGHTGGMLSLCSSRSRSLEQTYSTDGSCSHSTPASVSRFGVLPSSRKH